jgi:molybdenum cofactor cytidylyltransferase
LNPEIDRGMYSSIVAGIRKLPRWVEAAFILPADIPLVRAATIRHLARTRAASRAGILYPVFNGLRGHPPLIDRVILDEAARENSKGPLSAVLASHESDAVEVRVLDMAIHMDMDTPADYQALLSHDKRRGIPSAAECEEILAAGNVGPRVVQHSRKVGEIAGRIALALLYNGQQLDAELVQAGALLHDLAKGQSDHAAVGATALRTLGFDRVADVVADHTDLSTFSRLDESAIVYLADKLVRDDEVVTIEERFKPALMRFSKDPAALESARKRMRNARKVASAVESQVGASLAIIVSGDLSSKDHYAGQTNLREAGA